MVYFKKLNEINNLLLIVLLTLIIFCISYYIYYYNTVFDNQLFYETFDNTIDNKTMLLNLINKATINANKIIKEKFIVNENLIVQHDAEQYLKSLNDLQTWLNTSYYGENGMIAKIQSQLQTTNNIRNLNKNALLNLLTNIYVINYINYINRQNAESYKVYLKYKTPQQNKYYSQYLN